MKNNRNEYAGNIIIRFLVGAIFLSEGIQKFLYPDTLGVGRFIKIGIPAPEFLAPFVGITEIVCGSLVLLGLLTRWASIPLIIDITVAIITTKVPMLREEGFWKMAHEARTDYAVLLGSIYLLVYGGGRWSLDKVLNKQAKERF
ncbi:MAG: DoxX family protein [Sporocytophaga sp.]|uniref:DoxX family protein n=1 Tax=Sporocytophaga sp. TaxID=2231183 RepID=UPI001B2A4618|nr:DoxX family protein [Sporocytophaga sp.]MBO9703301.1 DoxX family protein [Sporocytophaga sp.]